MAKKVVVIGSGPAGLWAAYSAHKHGCRVTVLEARGRLGNKLLVSGAGKCNFTNVLSGESQAERFGRGWRFMLPAYQELSPKRLISELESLGVKAECVDGFHYFPTSGRASDILKALSSNRIEFITNVKASTPIIKDDRCVGVLCADGREFLADSVIMATGGVSYPQLGDVGSFIYKFAEEAGHKVTKLYPGMAGIKLAEERLGLLSALVLDCAELTFKFKKPVKSQGVVLFTYNGLSGPAVLDHSAEVAKHLERYGKMSLSLKWFSDLGENEWREFFSHIRKNFGKQKVSTQLGSRLTAKSAGLLLELAGVEEETICANFTAENQRRLSNLLVKMELTITGTEGWKKAMVTSGGIPIKEVSSDTMESKILSGLYFAGEVLELAGPCGGYNIQWASSSGYLAGKSVALG